MKATSSGVCSPFVSWPFRATYLVVEVFKWKGRPSDESCVLEQKAERERERGTALNLVVYDSVLSFWGEIRADNNNRGNRDQWRAGLFLLSWNGKAMFSARSLRGDWAPCDRHWGRGEVGCYWQRRRHFHALRRIIHKRERGSSRRPAVTLSKQTTNGPPFHVVRLLSRDSFWHSVPIGRT